MLDDHLVLFGEKGVGHKSLLGLFTDYQWDFYRPVGHIILWVSYRLLAEGSSLGYHIINLLLFILIVCFFYRITDVLTDNKSLAFFSALLYAWHPVNAMLVNYITANVISTFVLCLQGSLLLFLKATDGPRVRLGVYLLSLVLFGMALLSHEMSLMFPAYLICILFFGRGERFTKTVLRTLAYGILAGAYFWFRSSYFPLGETFAGVKLIAPHLGIYVASLMDLIYWYVSKLILPKGILFLWNGGDVALQWLMLEVVRVVSIMGVLIYLIFFRWKRGIKPLAMSIFVLGLMPVAAAGFTYFPRSEPIIEPHWFYFSSIGFFILITSLAMDLYRRFPQAVIGGLMGGLLGVMAVGTIYTNRLWRDQETYCRYWLSLNQRNMTPYYGLGKSLLEGGDYQKAIETFKQGLQAVHYYNAFILADLGYAQWLAGNGDQGLSYLQAAMEFDPTYSVTYHYLGQIYLQQQRHDEAAVMYQKAIECYPSQKDYHSWLARIRQESNI
jgi:hypothetical protein